MSDFCYRCQTVKPVEGHHCKKCAKLPVGPQRVTPEPYLSCAGCKWDFVTGAYGQCQSCYHPKSFRKGMSCDKVFGRTNDDWPKMPKWCPVKDEIREGGPT